MAIFFHIFERPLEAFWLYCDRPPSTQVRESQIYQYNDFDNDFGAPDRKIFHLGTLDNG